MSLQDTSGQIYVSHVVKKTTKQLSATNYTDSLNFVLFLKSRNLKLKALHSKDLLNYSTYSPIFFQSVGTILDEEV